MFLSVIIATYNPHIGRLSQVIDGLKKQTLALGEWEIIIVDNNSSIPFFENINLSWHPDYKIIKESKQGLTYARLKGFAIAKGDIVVMLDDDNIADADYLLQISKIFTSEENLGAIGGKSVALFEIPPPEWLNEFYGSLALRDLGDEVIIESWTNKYPVAAPIGAGMAIRKKALSSYIAKVTVGKTIITDRKGTDLSSGGDNDMVLEMLKSGWNTGYFPKLLIQHIIPKERTQRDYIARLINNSNKSWITLLNNHDINPWQKIRAWTLPFRKIKAWFIYSAWKNKVNYIRWRGACGTFDGLSDINST